MNEIVGRGDSLSGKSMISRSIFLCTCLAVCWLILKTYIPLQNIWVDSIGLLILAAVSATIPASWRSTGSNRYIFISGTLIAAGIGLFFRIHHINTVPLGYNDEALNFVFFAQRLVNENFPYIPYSWYAHTLFSYFIAVAMLFFESSLFAQRFASAFISSWTLLFLFLTLYRNVGKHAAWIGASLLGSSTWLAWATRNGYHQQLVPLFQLAFMYLFFEALRRKSYIWFFLAGISMVLGLHAHYGYYLMLVILTMFFLYMFLFHRDDFKSISRPLLWATISSICLLIPLGLFYLKNRSFLFYLNNVAPVESSTAVLQRISRNYQEMTQILFRKSEGFSLGDMLLGVTALSGFVISIRRFKSSAFHAFLLLMTLINIAGLLITLANIFYVIALMGAIFCYSALAINVVFEGFLQFKSKWVHATAFFVVAGVLFYQSFMNEDKFFTTFRDSRFVYAYGVPGNAYLIFDDVKKNLKDFEIYLPWNERERDFEIIPGKLMENMDDFKFLRQTKRFDTQTVVFPEYKTDGRKKGIRLYFANNTYYLDDIIRTYKTLYPNMQQNFIYLPEPYPKHPLISILEIPMSDIRSMWDFVHRDADDADSKAVVHIFETGIEGFYQFRFKESPTQTGLTIDGTRIELNSGLNDRESSVFLEKGIHLISMDISGGSLDSLEFRMPAQEWSSTGSHTLKMDLSMLPLIDPYLASIGIPGKTYPVIDYNTSFSSISDLMMDSEGNLAVLENGSVSVIDPENRLLTKVQLPNAGQYNLGRLDGQWIATANNGKIFVLQGNNVSDYLTIPYTVNRVDSNNHRLIAYCNGNLLVTVAQGKYTLTEIQPPSPDLKVDFNDIAIAPDGFYAIEFRSSKLYWYNSKGEIVDQKKLSHLRLPNVCEIDSDNEGNVYISSWNSGFSAYSQDRHILYNPITKTRCLFPRCEDGANHLLRFKFKGKMPVMTWYDNQIIRFR